MRILFLLTFLASFVGVASYQCPGDEECFHAKNLAIFKKNQNKILAIREKTHKETLKEFRNTIEALKQALLQARSEQRIIEIETRIVEPQQSSFEAWLMAIFCLHR